MNAATRTTVSIFSALAGLAGIEHGIGAVLQGNVAPAGLTFESWPDSESFTILDGEPAMTVVPNLLVTGILAIAASVVFIIWATVFVERRNGGLVLLLLSLLVLLVGGGFGPPVLGFILGAAATRIRAPLSWWRMHLPPGARRLLAAVWPRALGAGVIAWLSLFPGSVIVAYLLGTDGTSAEASTAVSVLTVSAFGLLLLTIAAGFAHDIGRPTVAARIAAMGRK